MLQINCKYWDYKLFLEDGYVLRFLCKKVNKLYLKLLYLVLGKYKYILF